MQEDREQEKQIWKVN